MSLLGRESWHTWCQAQTGVPARASVDAFGLAALSSLTQIPTSLLFPSPYLVTDQIPFLLIVILPQKPGLVRRQIHGALRKEPESIG
jgi:hypothetical protein